ncbi:MAG: radical SAM protein [Clostridia bacterium]|nr:radical SAM protein [Clostridia bacterium]
MISIDLLKSDKPDIKSENRCMLCPIECGADRAVRPGACGVGGFAPKAGLDPYKSALVARAARHYYEEPPISGTNGSGAIFFSGCNMACIFCQNMDISHFQKGRLVGADELAAIMLRLQELGSHNINLVTPSPHVALIADAIPLARKRGLELPILYNTNSYEKVEALRRLDGLIDIYLPDLKYRSAAAAEKYSGRESYFEIASAAVLEMQRQCGVLTVGEGGIASRGVLIRHLVLPGSVDETRGVLDFIRDELPLETHISLMSQYTPMGENLPKPLDRRLLKREYARALDYAIGIGFPNIYAQELSSAESAFTPEFNGYFE